MPNTVMQSSKSVEWYTPSKYVEAARNTMGSIDLDPASCAFANRIVKANAFFSERGLESQWFGNVFCNPPYGRRDLYINKKGEEATKGPSNQMLWSQKMIQSHKSGEIQQGILLVNAQTCERWFQPLWNYSICFTNHRIKFIDQNGEIQKQPAHGNAFIYFGNNTEAFEENFYRFGTIYMPYVLYHPH